MGTLHVIPSIERKMFPFICRSHFNDLIKKADMDSLKKCVRLHTVEYLRDLVRIIIQLRPR